MVVVVVGWDSGMHAVVGLAAAATAAAAADSVSCASSSCFSCSLHGNTAPPVSTGPAAGC